MINGIWVLPVRRCNQPQWQFNSSLLACPFTRSDVMCLLFMAKLRR